MKIIIANWKMNPVTEEEAVNLVGKIAAGASNIKEIETVITPPFVFLKSVLEKKGNLKVGAQDVFWENRGAYTGEVSPLQLKNLGVSYVIIGHSERRKWLGETDEVISKKVKATVENGLRAVLCVGEAKEIRNKGIDEAKKFVQEQLKKGLDGINKSYGTSLVVAYEPVWAISTFSGGKSDNPADAAEIISFIKKVLLSEFGISSPLVLYGGSVSGKNIADFAAHDSIDGFLVGSASLQEEEFLEMIKVVSSFL